MVMGHPRFSSQKGSLEEARDESASPDLGLGPFPGPHIQHMNIVQRELTPAAEVQNLVGRDLPWTQAQAPLVS